MEEALQRLGVAYRQIQAGGARADQAARSLGVEPGAVVKSLLFLADGEPVLVLVGGDRRADPVRLRELLGSRRVMIAPPERVEEETGFPPGAVPPVGHPAPLPTWIDAALVHHPTLYCSGGAPDVMVALSSQDLLRATGGRIARLGSVSSNSVKIFSLDRDEVVERLRAAAYRLRVSCPEVQDVRLFGSLARGDYVGTSDADVLVIVEGEVPPDPIARIQHFYPYFALSIGLDLLVYTPAEIEQNAFARRIYAESESLLVDSAAGHRGDPKD